MLNLNKLKYIYDSVSWHLKHKKSIFKVWSKARFVIENKKTRKKLFCKLLVHDLDKIFDKKRKKHRFENNHHIEKMLSDNETKTIDVFEAFIDWESARFSKPEKPLTALQWYETGIKHRVENDRVLKSIFDYVEMKWRKFYGV